MKFHHVALSVKNLEVSKLFYENILGFKEVKRFERPDLGGQAVFLKLNGLRLELWEFNKQKPNEDDFSDLNAIGYKHIALQVADVQQTCNELKAKGIEVTEPTQGAMAKYIFIKDPDGLPLELLEWSENF